MIRYGRDPHLELKKVLLTALAVVAVTVLASSPALACKHAKVGKLYTGKAISSMTTPLGPPGRYSCRIRFQAKFRQSGRTVMVFAPGSYCIPASEYIPPVGFHGSIALKGCKAVVTPPYMVTAPWHAFATGEFIGKRKLKLRLEGQQTKLRMRR